MWIIKNDVVINVNQITNIDRDCGYDDILKVCLTSNEDIELQFANKSERDQKYKQIKDFIKANYQVLEV